MRLFLYDNHETLLSVQKAQGSISREINVFDELTASVPATKENVDIFQRAMYIGVPIRGRKEFQLFKVEKADLNSNPLSITGIESAADDLAVHNIIIDRRFVDKKMSEILPAVFENSGWEYKQLAPDTDTATTNFYRISSKEALQKVESNFGVEVQFIYTPKGNQIANKTCEIHKQIGTDAHLRLVQGVNVTEVKYTQDQTELYTAAIGRGSGLQNTDDEGEATGGYTRKIEFDDVVWSKSAGNPVDKPAGQKYVEIPEATEKYGWLDKNGKRKPRMVTFDFDNEKDVNKLIQETYDKLLPLSHPQVQIESTVAKIGQYVHLGDDATVVIYKPYKLTYTARVIKMEDNPDDEEQSKVTVGFSTVKRQAERELDQQQTVADTTQSTTEQIEANNEETKRKLTEIDKNASQQIQKAQKAIQEFEKKTGKEIDDAKQQIADFVNQNSSDSPLQFYGTDGNIVSGIPPVSYIKSKDGSFELNSRGFKWGDHLLGGDGQLYADGIVGEKIVGYDIEGAHVTGGSFSGCTFDGSNYFRSVGSGGFAVMSGDKGFSFAGTHIGDQTVSFDNGDNWSGDGFYTHGHVKASGAVTANGGLYIGGEQLTSSDISKLHRLKG